MADWMDRDGTALWRRRWGLQLVVVLGAALAVVVLCALWWRAPDLYDDSGVGADARAAATATTRAGILVVIGAIVAALGATLALLETHRANREPHDRDLKVQQEMHEADQETKRANREADQRERYTKAIDQLGTTGADRVDVRLGGIYALLRLAQDSDRDLPTVVEVLCAFVRGHAQEPEDSTPQALGKHQQPRDVQAALTVVKRVHDPDRGSYIDLRAVHIERVNLSDGNLTGADLTGANLRGSSLARSNLHDANLAVANLAWSSLEGANLSGGWLTADLTGANLTGVNLTNANLHDANLTGADLTGADLSGADLSGADLSGADLSGADLTPAIGLTQDQVTTAARGDEETQLPSGLIRPEHWMPPPSGSNASLDKGGDSG
jgi:pentapeptide repeat protein